VAIAVIQSDYSWHWVLSYKQR